jgi:hypothetical protein
LIIALGARFDDRVTGRVDVHSLGFVHALALADGIGSRDCWGVEANMRVIRRHASRASTF